MADAINLKPALTPGPLPVDLKRMDLSQYRRLCREAGALETPQPLGKTWQLSQVYTADDRQHFARLSINDSESVDLTADSAVLLARHLVEYAIALANCNSQPQIAHAVLKVLEHFTDPSYFVKFKQALIEAAERELLAASDRAQR